MLQLIACTEGVLVEMTEKSVVELKASSFAGSSLKI